MFCLYVRYQRWFGSCWVPLDHAELPVLDTLMRHEARWLPKVRARLTGRRRRISNVVLPERYVEVEFETTSWFGSVRRSLEWIRLGDGHLRGIDTFNSDEPMEADER